METMENRRHGITDDVPSENQLSLSAITDVNGNYTISGVPFSGDGTSYTIRPSMGGHEFSAAKANRFVSAQSLVHNGVDFQDVSSFSVSGVVYYQGTTIPVEGVQFAVDGVSCTKDGEFIQTNERVNIPSACLSAITISVPASSVMSSAMQMASRIRVWGIILPRMRMLIRWKHSSLSEIFHPLCSTTPRLYLS